MKTFLKVAGYSLAILLLIILLFRDCDAGCNKSIGFGTFKFNYLYIYTGDGYVCYSIDKWYESADGIEVVVDGHAIWLSEGTYIISESPIPGLEVTNNE